MNSTAVVLMIITVLTYGIVCIGKRMELMDAVTVSFAVLLAGFGMSGGILALFGGFSLNKTLAVLWLLSVVAAVICRIAGGKPNVCLKQTESIVRPFLRTLILLCLAGLVYVVTMHFQPEDDVMINAGKRVYTVSVAGIRHCACACVCGGYPDTLHGVYKSRKNGTEDFAGTFRGRNGYNGSRHRY